MKNTGEIRELQNDDSAAANWADEVSKRKRFEFGSNWARYLKQIDSSLLEAAERSLTSALGVHSLEGQRFLDAGSGSGLFSAAAHRLGADVVSFDFDPESVACTTELRRRFGSGPAPWRIEHGSVLDAAFVASLGQFHVVYSWGVLHHTGAMWSGLENVANAVRPGGHLFISIYNDQGRSSRVWARVKHAYVAAPRPLRWLILLPAFVRLWGPTTLRDLVRGNPGRSWRNYRHESARGMDPWRDVVDWVGGYPFEVAKPEEVFSFLRERGFHLQYLTTCAGGPGCNEFVLSRTPGV
jgi:2-polyprenyl-3-methyl-5-hydroxy-6-metoxy-1,4-benzoquinol methylase